MVKAGIDTAAPLLPSPHPPSTFYGIPVGTYNPHPPPEYVILTSLPRRRRRPPCCRCCGSLLSSSCLLAAAFFAALLFAAVFIVWPADPELSVARLHLDRIRVYTSSPVASLDVALGLDIRVRNRDFFGLNYDSIVVSIAYRGKKLGAVTSGGGLVRPLGVSYVDADLHLYGIQVLSDVFYLIEDVARGSIPFETTTEVKGLLRLFFLDVPIQGRISCSVHVNPLNQTVVRQDCYPE